MLDVMGLYTEEWKIKFNADKSKAMVVGMTRDTRRWTINGQEMEEMKVFKYLGVWFNRGM